MEVNIWLLYDTVISDVKCNSGPMSYMSAYYNTMYKIISSYKVEHAKALVPKDLNTVHNRSGGLT
jgi:hypothetical protein